MSSSPAVREGSGLHPVQDPVRPPVRRTRTASAGLLLALVMAVLAGVLVVLGVLAYLAQRSRVLASAGEALSRLAAERAERVEAWIDGRYRQARSVGRDPLLASAVASWLAAGGPDGPQRAILEAKLAALVDGHGDAAAWLCDAGGVVRLSVPRARPFSEQAARALEQVKAGHDDLVATLHAGPGATPVLEVEVVIALGSGGPGPVGHLVRSTDAWRSALAPLAADLDGPGSRLTAVRAEGAGLLVASGGGARRITGPLTRPSAHDTLLIWAALGGRGVRPAFSPEGRPVLAAAAPVPRTEWSVLATIPVDEPLAPLRRDVLVFGLTGALAFCASGLVARLLWKQSRLRQVLGDRDATLREQALLARLGALWQQTNDAILLLSHELEIVEANHAAGELFGFTPEELRGRNLRSMRRSNEGPSSESLRRRALRSGSVRFEASYLTKDGREVPMEVSSRVVKVGPETFFQSVFRDATARRAADERLEWLAGLLGLLSDCSKAIVRVREAEPLLLEVCRLAADVPGLATAQAVVVTGGHLSLVHPTGSLELAAPEGLTGANAPQEPLAALAGDAARSGEVRVVERQGPGGGAWAAFPVLRAGVPAAVLVFSSPRHGAFDASGLELLGGLALDLSVAFDDLVREERRAATERALKEAVERLAEAERVGRVGSFVLDLATESLRWSDGARRLLGLGPDEVPADLAGFLSLVHEADLAEVRAALQRASQSGGTEEVDLRALLPLGAVRWLSATLEPGLDVSGCPVRVVATVADITSRRRSEERRLLWARVVEGISDGLLVLDGGWRILRANSAFEKLTGYSLAELSGKSPSLLRSRHHDDGFYEEMRRELRSAGAFHGEIWLRRKDGGTTPALISASLLGDEAARPSHVVALFTDLTERKSAAERIDYLSQHDALTGLPNRTILMARFEQGLASARREGRKLGVLFLDLDRFKTVNESLGHAAGDDLLKAVAARLSGSLRRSDSITRLGGDKFLIVAPEIGDVGTTAHLAQKILAVVQGPYVVGDRELSVTASLGIALHPDDGVDAATLARNAESAVDHAKEAGRNGFKFFAPEMNARSLALLETETRLRRALDREELTVHFQPQLELATGRLVGVEALVRWNDPDRGLVPPSEFIPIAEASGLIVPVGERVLRLACSQVRSLEESTGLALRLAVNVSALQFRQPGLRDTVERALAESGLPASMLELELTEGILMRDADGAVERVCALKELGVLVSIDDFGTGFSSLSYLRRLPVDRLKIDQSFVRDLGAPNDAAPIVKAVIGLTESLGLESIAEGIETEAQLERLKEHGCREGQGYLLARPMPIDQLERWVVSRGLAISP